MHGLRLTPGCLRARPWDPKLQLPLRTGIISVFTCYKRGRSSIHPPALGRSSRPLRVHASFGDDWNPRGEIGAVLQEVYKRVQPVANALMVGLQTVFRYQREWVQQAWARTILAWAIALGIFTAAINAWGIPQLNSRLPQLAQQAAVVLKRDVEVGRVLWLAPTGLLGLHPIGSVGPISVGPGPVERSSATLDRVAVGVNPLQSILRQRIVLTVKATGAEVHLKQADNYSWFGFPDDTMPTSRNFLPGLEGGKEENGKGPGSGGENGGSGSGGSGGGRKISQAGGSSSGQKQRYRSATGAVPLHASISGSTPRQNGSESPESFLTSVANELLAWHAAKDQAAQDALRGAGGALQDDKAPQQLVLMSTSATGTPQAATTASDASSADTSNGGATNNNTSPPAAVTSTSAPAPPASGKGWRTFFPFQSPKQTRAQVNTRKQQIEALNTFKLSTPGAAPTPTPSPPSNTIDSTASTAALHTISPAAPEGFISDSSAVLPVVKESAVTSAAPNLGTTPTLSETTQIPAAGLISQDSPSFVAVEHSGAASTPSAVEQQPVQSLSHTQEAEKSGASITLEEAPGTVSSETETAGNVQASSPEASEYHIQASSVPAAFKPAAVQIKEAPSTPLPAPLPGRLMPSNHAAAALNSLPALHIDIRSKEGAAGGAVVEVKEPEVEQVALPAEPSAASLRINKLQGIAVGSMAPPVAAVRTSPNLAHFQEAVIDQATVRRKALGSKALQKARNWQPTKHRAEVTSPIDRNKLPTAANSPPTTGSITAPEGSLAIPAPSDEGSVLSEESAESSSKNHGHKHPTNIMHPGYFSPTPGPVYTPAPPEALAGIRAKQRKLGAVVQQITGAAGALLQRSLVLGSVELTGGTLYGHIHGEELPRVFENVSASVFLGPSYDTLNVNIDASPQERNPASIKCTMPTPSSHRHLRDYTGLAALRAQQEVSLSEATTNLGEGGGEKSLQEEDGNFTTATPPNSSEASAASGGPSLGHPTGGKVRVTVNATGLADNELAIGGSRVPDMIISVQGRNLHAPLVERIFELPMDINDGRANGEFILKMHDLATWHAPEYHGRVAVRGANFHFWDATDDIMDADLDLLFEGDRLYLHKAKGRFGAVPMTLTGDLDLNPLTGQYRLSATVPNIEINALRATLGVRPTPFPVAGAVSGTLHVTGPLEKPVFSGIAKVVRPTAEALADCEPTNALEMLLSEPEAVGAYDRVPIASAELVFSLDTAKERMTLHAFKASPIGGGELQGSGSMGVSPASETDPSAIDVVAYGSNIPAASLARRYLPEDTQIPPGIIVGTASVNATMKGAHLAPVIDVAYSMPEGSVSGSVQFTREATSLSVVSPSLDGTGTVFLRPPSYDAAKAAITQEQATELAKPDIAGCDADVVMRGLDIVPLVSDEESLRRLAQQSGEPLRLRVNGRAKITGTVANAEPRESVVDAVNSPFALALSKEGDATAAAVKDPWQFAGTLDLEDVKLNQLKLYRALKGTIKLSNSAVAVHAKGVRPDEALDIDLVLPLLPEGPRTSSQEENEVANTSTAPGEAVVPSQELSGSTAEAAAATESISADISPVVVATTTAAAAVPAVEAATPSASGSSVAMRCGQLLASATMDATGSQLDMRVANVKLDELELASLRGELQEISCSLNFQSQTGRGRVSLAAPRYSGLRGDSLSGGFRWERDVVRLEKLVLQQRRSKYEVQGEYVVPPSVGLPTSAADLARRQAEQRIAAQGRDGPAGSASALPVAGRWRLRVDVPAADMQEILPAARLLQSATSRGPADYERAKTAFISAVKELSLKAQDLNGQLRALAEKLADARDIQDKAARAGSSAPAAPFQLPALQDVHGHWSGSIQAFGGGGGATSCEFDVRGTDWQWGQATLDAVVANGSYHSEEGVQLQEFVLKSDDAKLLIRGSLLSDHQDATFLLTDFPVTKFRPLFRAIPALKNAAPAASAKVPEPVPSPLPLGMLANALGQASQGLQGHNTESDSPINGMLYISGTLGGSKTAPSGEVAVRLYDAAIGPTRLSQAQASARLSDKMQLSFNVDVVPVEGHRKSGHIRAAGSIPLAPFDATGNSSSANGGSDGPSPAPGPLDVRVSVRDSGMAVLTSMAPDFQWSSGQADVSFRLTGTVEQPTVTGAALINKAIIDCPVLKYPLQVMAADIRCAEGMMEVETVDVKVGRKGHLRVRGVLPVYQTKQSNRTSNNNRSPTPVPAAMQHRITVDVQGLEVRVRNIYTGQLDALVTVRDSVERPVVGGSLRFSRGAVYIIPQGQEVGSTSSGLPTTSGTAPAAPPGPSVAKVFNLLTRRESGLAARLEDAVRQEVEAVEHMVEEAAGPNLMLDSLALQFGPDLRAVYPLVMNFGVAGELVTSGPAHPDSVAVQGVLKLPGGDLNLVAAQLELDREHSNTLSFGGATGGAAGLDPVVDIVLTSGDLRLSVLGRASEWADHLVMQSVGGASAGGDAGEQLDATEAARILETKLKAALLADDGQLALSRLAGSTVSTLMPKLETQGTMGGAKWRLVSAPAIPGLLDPLQADPTNLLGSITIGTEVEVQFGRKLQATMVRKPRDSDVNTQWTLNYLLNSKLRMQFNISSAPPYSKTLMFQYSSE